MVQKAPTRVELLRGTLDSPDSAHAAARTESRSRHRQTHSADLRRVVQVGTGSLYPALYRLEAKGWIAATWAQSEKGKRAR